MAEGKRSFVAYTDRWETFEQLPDDKAGQLAKHLWRYVNDEDPQTDDILINAVFAQMKQTLKRDLAKYEVYKERQSKNWKKWGRPKGSGTNHYPEGCDEWYRYVYLLEDITTWEVKVWETAHLKNRVYTIKRPTKNLEIIDYWIVDDYRSLEIENNFRAEFKEKSIGGDWFNWIDKKKAVAFLYNQWDIKKADSVSVSVSVSDSVSVSVSDKGTEEIQPEAVDQKLQEVSEDFVETTKSRQLAAKEAKEKKEKIALKRKKKERNDETIKKFKGKLLEVSERTGVPMEYDVKGERSFAEHSHSKKFKEVAAKYGYKTTDELLMWLIEASAVWWWLGRVCSIQSAYQNYAKIINEFNNKKIEKKDGKQSNKIPSIKGRK